MKGTIGILSVGAGDTTLTFDGNDPAELERAKRIVTDMLRRGYAILIPVGERDGEPIYRRAKAFDPKTCEYIIAGIPADTIPESTVDGNQESAPEAASKPTRGRGRRKKAPTDRVAASSVNAVAVGRISGG
jgi:hypothetical protein